MKVTIWYEPPTQELDVEVTVEHIARALKEAPDRPYAVMRMMNAAAQSMEATTDEIIAEMGPAQREAVENFLTEQAARFRCENSSLSSTTNQPK